MAESRSALVPVRANEVALGKPLSWPVYDAHGKLLLQRGAVVASETQLEGILANGFFVDGRWRHGSGWAPDAGKPQKLVSAGRHHHEDPVASSTLEKETAVRMEDVRWHIGETLFLQVVENPKLRYSVPLLGFARNQTVMVGAPEVDGKLEFIREGQSFVVRAFAGKKVYAFTAAAVKSMLTPHPYLHLSWPRQIGCTVVRAASRAPVNLVASMSLGAEHMAAAALCDLSVGGCSALLKQPFGLPGAEGRIKFRVCAAGQEEYLNLKVVLRSVMSAPVDGGELRHGLEFVEISTHERLILSAFVHQTLVDLDEMPRSERPGAGQAGKPA